MSGRSADSLPQLAGSALVWQTVQVGGVNLIYLVRLVVLGRLLAPDDFGLFAVALVALDFLLAVTDFGMVPALVQRPDPGRRHYQAAWTIGFLRALAVSAVLIVSAPLVAELFGEPRAAPLLQVLAAKPLLEAMASMGVAKLSKELRFRELSVLRLSEAAVNAGVSILLVSSLGVWALVAGPVAAAAVYSILSYFLEPIAPRLRFSPLESKQLARYGRWILVTAWATLAGRVLLEMGISRQLGAAALGLYYMSKKLAFLPVDVSNQVVASVAFPVFARLQSDPERGRVVFRRGLIGLCVLIVPLCFLIVALAPTLAVDVLGDQWVDAVDLIRILAAVAAVGILGDMVVPLLEGYGHPERSAALNVLQYATLVALAWVFIGPFGVEGAAAAWLPAVLVSQFLALVFLHRLFPRPFEGLWKAIGSSGFAAALAVVAAIGVDRIVDGVPGALAALAVGGSVAIAVIAATDRYVGIGIASTVGRLFPRLKPVLRSVGYEQPFAASSHDEDDLEEG